MKFTAIALAVCAASIVLSRATAQIPQDMPVARIDIQGLERVSEQLVRAQLEVQVGQPINRLAIARDIRRLYDLRRFAQVQADASVIAGQLVVTYIVTEERYIDEVKIIGNRRVREREIRSVINWKEGDSFYEGGYNAEREAILDLYRSKGYLTTTVDIVVEELSPARVRVTYIVDEGRKARIRSIEFVGNEALTDSKLRKTMQTKRARWLFGGRYNEERFEEDLRELVREYSNYGRLEADILDTQFEHGENGKRLDLTIQVSEGPEYTVGSLDVADNVVFDDDELLQSVEVLSGEVHNQGQVEEDANLLQTGYQDAGYVDAQVRPIITLDRERKTTNIAHQILEGNLKYVREIKIRGNNVTRDEVIRRRVLLLPGDRFDGAAIRATKAQLEALDYFEPSDPEFGTGVNTILEPIPDDERFENLLIDVEEGRTGNFNFGGGYSTTEGFGGFVEFRFRNFDITNWPTFSGGGQEFAINLAIGEVRDEYSVSFTDPEFMGYPFAFGVDLFDQSYRTQGGSDYTEETQGGQIRLVKSLSPFVTGRTSLRFTRVELQDFTGIFGILLNPSVRELRDPGTTIANGWGFTRDTLDHYRDPTQGAVHSVDLTFAGLGGDNDFVKLEQDSAWFWPLDQERQLILSFRTRNAIGFAYGDKELIPINERYFAGGSTTIRGYDTRDVGPKERTYLFFGEEEAIGGEARILNSLELKYKWSRFFRLYGFIDSGGVWKQVSDFDLGDIKYSIGLGVGFDIPQLGPFRLDYGFAINPDEDQGSGRLHIQTGFRF